MTKISQYPTLSNPTEDDILIGTDVNSSDVTKNFSIGSIINLVENFGRPYKVYTALLTQVGDDDPVATVLENTLQGTPVWTRYSLGTFDCTLEGAFLEGKTFCIITVGTDDYNSLTSLGRLNSDIVRAVYTEGIGSNVVVQVEIRVYN